MRMIRLFLAGIAVFSLTSIIFPLNIESFGVTPSCVITAYVSPHQLICNQQPVEGATFDLIRFGSNYQGCTITFGTVITETERTGTIIGSSGTCEDPPIAFLFAPLNYLVTGPI